MLLNYGKLRKSLRPITITVGNYKGGVGKTTNSVMLSYTLAKKGLRTLVVDLDAQGNATSFLTLTRARVDDSIFHFPWTLMRAVELGKFDSPPLHIMDNLDLIPSGADFANFPKFLFRNTHSVLQESRVIEGLLDQVKSKYDIIILDIPPMNKEITNNATFASDYVVVSLQTQERSLAGAIEYIEELIDMKVKYDLPVELLGFLPSLMGNATLDNYVLEQASHTFGEENIFKSQIKPVERVKVWDTTGIAEEDAFDVRALAMFEKAADELILRLCDMEGISPEEIEDEYLEEFHFNDEGVLEIVTDVSEPEFTRDGLRKPSKDPLWAIEEVWMEEVDMPYYLVSPLDHQLGKTMEARQAIHAKRLSQEKEELEQLAKSFEEAEASYEEEIRLRQEKNKLYHLARNKMSREEEVQRALAKRNMERAAEVAEKRRQESESRLYE